MFDQPLRRPVRRSLVQDQQVDLVDPEFPRALVERVQRLVVAVVADPDLGLDEDLRAVDAGAPDGVTDLALVEVGGGGVDVAVARGQRRLHCGDGLLGRRLEDPEPQGGDLDAVVQPEQWHGRAGHARHPSRWVSVRVKPGTDRASSAATERRLLSSTPVMAGRRP
jgi:hypothetical protein